MQLTNASQSGTWQEHCTTELIRCATLEAKVPGSGSADWRKTKAQLALQKRILIADAIFSKASLQDFDFSQCYIIRVDFTHANLSGARFVQAIIKYCDFSHARLKSADVMLAHFQNCHLNLGSSVADIHGVRPWLAEMIRNQQYVADHDGNSRTKSRKIWDYLTGHGNSVKNLMLASLLLVLTFSALFIGTQEILGFQVTPRANESLLGLVEFAALNFLNAGPPFNGDNTWVTFLVILNVMAGVGVLGIFIALLGRKLIVFVQ